MERGKIGREKEGKREGGGFFFRDSTVSRRPENDEEEDANLDFFLLCEIFSVMLQTEIARFSAFGNKL